MKTQKNTNGRQQSTTRRMKTWALAIAMSAMIATAGLMSWNADSRFEQRTAQEDQTARFDVSARTESPEGFVQFAQLATSKETSEAIQSRLTRRYQNPLVMRFLRTLSVTSGTELYAEASRMIDTRHLEPSTYDARTRRAVRNLMHAAENPAFREAAGISPTAQQVRTYQSTMARLLSEFQAKSSADAMNAMRWSVEVASRHLNLGAGPVVTEFLYGAAESLDKYSTFVPPERDNRPQASLKDHVVGIGVSIKPEDRGVVIEKVIPDGSAEAAELQKGDVITAVDGKLLAGKSLDFVVDLIVGPEGSQMKLDVTRDGAGSGSVRLTAWRSAILFKKSTYPRRMPGQWVSPMIRTLANGGNLRTVGGTAGHSGVSQVDQRAQSPHLPQRRCCRSR